MTALPARMSERSYTASEFEALPEFDERYELIDERLVKKSMPNSEHSIIAYIIMKKHIRFDPDEKLGIMLQEVSTKLDDRNVLLPDIAYWKIARKPKRQPTAATWPDLAIEIWSPHDYSTKKRRAEGCAKAHRYLEAGSSLVWIINPQNQTVEIYQPEQPEQPQILQKGDELSAEDLIPGFRLAVADLFETD